MKITDRLIVSWIKINFSKFLSYRKIFIFIPSSTIIYDEAPTCKINNKEKNVLLKNNVTGYYWDMLFQKKFLTTSSFLIATFDMNQ